jgi:hypothetical protein
MAHIKTSQITEEPRTYRCNCRASDFSNERSHSEFGIRLKQRLMQVIRPKIKNYVSKDTIFLNFNVSFRSTSPPPVFIFFSWTHVSTPHSQSPRNFKEKH